MTNTHVHHWIEGECMDVNEDGKLTGCGAYAPTLIREAETELSRIRDWLSWQDCCDYHPAQMKAIVDCGGCEPCLARKALDMPPKDPKDY